MATVGWGVALAESDAPLGQECEPPECPQIHVRRITLQGNNLVGTLPPNLADIKSLVSVDFTANRLTGPVPTQLPTGLVALKLTSNNFTDGWPEALSTSFPGLSVIDLSQNPLLGGTIPTSITQLSELSYISLASSGITGTLPHELGNLTNLVIASFGHNQLTGTIPARIFLLPYLNSLFLSDNFLVGPLPRAIVESHNLALDLRNNKIVDELDIELQLHDFEGPSDDCLLPPFTRALVGCRVVDLSNNNISGSLALHFDRFAAKETSNLVRLSLTGNSLAHDRTVGLPDWILPSLSSQISYDEDSFLCSTLRVRGGHSSNYASFLDLEVDPEYFRYFHCRCSPKTVGIAPNCGECPRHAICLGGTDIAWPRGYYPIIKDGYYVGVQKCLDAHRLSSKCNPLQNAEAVYATGLISGDLCSNSSYGRLCSQCQCEPGEPCYYWRHDSCALCEFNTVALVGTIGVVTIALSALLLALLQKPSKAVYKFYAQTSGSIKIILLHMQVCALVIDWPVDRLDAMLSVLYAVSASLEGFGFPCILPFMRDPVNALATHIVFPWIVFLLIALTVIVVRFIKMNYWGKEHKIYALTDDEQTEPPRSLVEAEEEIPTVSLLSEEQSDTLLTMSRNFHRPPRNPVPLQNLIIRLSVGVSLFFYFPVMETLVSMLTCVEEPLTQQFYVLTIPWLSCDPNSNYGLVRSLAVVFIIAYGLGVPIYYILLMVKYKEPAGKPTSRLAQATVGSLYNSYRPEKFWFEFAFIGFRLAISIVSNVVRDDDARDLGVVCILSIFFFIHVWHQAFAKSVDNKLAGLSIAMLMFSYMASTRWANLDHADPHFDVLLYITAGSNIAVVVIGLVAAGVTTIRANIATKELKHALKDAQEAPDE